jgi:hypothetical protein
MISVERKLSTEASTQISKSFRLRRSSLKRQSFHTGVDSTPDTNLPTNKLIEKRGANTIKTHASKGNAAQINLNDAKKRESTVMAFRMSQKDLIAGSFSCEPVQKDIKNGSTSLSKLDSLCK